MFSHHHIFFVNCATLVFILFVCTVIGRQLANLSPFKLRPFVKFYLSPALGLASIILAASLIGRLTPLGESLTAPFAFFALSFLALGFERNFWKTLQHTALISIFALLCATPMLAQLFTYGGYDAHNDAFTYLAHSDWLQHHAFGSSIPPTEITPASTQVSMYQTQGYRMGASYLLAFFQAVLHYRWAYSIYPSVILAALVICSLSLGLVISLTVTRLNRIFCLGFLSLPCLGFGGLTFGCLYGFFPQTVGLAMGGAVIFLFGAVLPQIVNRNFSWPKQFLSAVLVSLLFAACCVAYSELIVFVLAAIVLSTLTYTIKTRQPTPYLRYGVMCSSLSLLFINIELPRVIRAIYQQTQSVVGTPVDWPLTGYVVHQLGVHGGAWDIYQWTKEQTNHPATVISLVILFALAMAIVLYKRRHTRFLRQSVMLPSLITLLLFSIGILYFRYFVANPFSVGTGQSWSQFKLANWSSPFISVVLISGLALLFRKWKVLCGLTLAILISTLVHYNIDWSKERMQHVMAYYLGVPNLEKFYKDTRDHIISKCENRSIYLDLTEVNHKFRQMLSLFLADQKLISDWRGDGYIINSLPKNMRNGKPALGDCLVERDSVGEKFIKITTIDGHEDNIIVSAIGGYDREQDYDHFWYWVKHQISFRFKRLFSSSELTHTKLYFKYFTTGDHTVTISVTETNKKQHVFILQNNKAGDLKTFEEILDIPPSQIKELRVKSNGAAQQLGESDSRLAAFRIFDVKVTPWG
ncbi:hypothetical protein [Legionella micdadei]|uniref:Uncharacterized protein n=1 Tax=Legionella micdadei TaxID=451 RepID=A0A098GLF0_LEGMI|nr:hypothetical protein [Legionella micdadei]ARH01449.1 hypothetical protein B6V88_14160 [Legionella micdadei]KTD28949.1 hypothetical protein Lmic_0869 [Legionella micdadei]CEG62331.1 membrane protein of unknown function [Legionella micdadei]SCY03379.1 hypothetical protein SAMN02982997_00664 [Legionella micdadei]